LTDIRNAEISFRKPARHLGCIGTIRVRALAHPPEQTNTEKGNGGTPHQRPKHMGDPEIRNGTNLRL